MRSLVQHTNAVGGRVSAINIPDDNLFGGIATNPSCAVYGGSLMINCRIVNYTKLFGWLCSDNSNQEYVDNRPIHSDNVIVYNDQVYNIDIPAGLDEYYTGLEDARLVVWDGILYMYGTRWDIKSGYGVIIIYQLDSDFKVTDSFIINSPYNSTCEKNWSAVEGKPFTFIYKHNPTIVLVYNKEDGTVKLTEQIIDSKLELRGNTNLIKLPNGSYITLAHESKYNGNQLNYHFHFIVYNENFEIVRISDEFCFMNDTCEFSCGMVLDNNSVMITFSELDASAYMLDIPLTGLLEFILDDGPGVEYDWLTHYEEKANSLIDQGKTKNAMPFLCMLPKRYDRQINILTYYLTQVFNDSLTARIRQELEELTKDHPMAELYYLLTIVYKRQGIVYTAEMYKELAKGLSRLGITPTMYKYLDINSI